MVISENELKERIKENKYLRDLKTLKETEILKEWLFDKIAEKERVCKIIDEYKNICQNLQELDNHEKIIILNCCNDLKQKLYPENQEDKP